MKVIYPTAQTRQFYERNSLTRMLAFTLGPTAPHASTSRGSYTVPANRRALLTNLYLWVNRDTAGAAPGTTINRLQATINSVSSNIGKITFYDNTANVPRTQFNPLNVWLNAGDVVEFFTYDGSSSGTISYEGGVTYIEFDV